MKKTLVSVWLWLFLILNGKVDSEHVKCQETPIKYKEMCTIVSYTSDNKTFTLHSNYTPEFINNLRFIDSKITSMGLELLEYFTNITSLDASNCHVTDIKPGTFSKALNLKRINLSHNYLTRLLGTEFTNAYIIEEINLSYNRINEIDGVTFSRLKKLNKIDLSFNRISNHSSLDSLNQIETINLNANTLDSLNLDNSAQKILHADSNQLGDNDVHIKSDNNTLIELSLRNNSLKSLNFLKYLPRISTLDVSHNPLEYADTDWDVFANLTNLENLFLQSTNLDKFDFVMFTKVTEKLLTLDISDNRLNFIDFNRLAHLEKLEQLFLNNNRLGENQNFDEFEYLFENLTLIDISENQWPCTKLIGVLKMFKQSSIHIVRKQTFRDDINVRGIRCINNTINAVQEEQEQQCICNCDCNSNKLEDCLDAKAKPITADQPTVNEDCNLKLGTITLMLISLLVLLFVFFLILLVYFVRPFCSDQRRTQKPENMSLNHQSSTV